MKTYFRDEAHCWIRSLEFKDISVDELVARAVARRDEKSRPLAWVLDLDSTLFCVSPRIRNIYHEFLRAHPAPPLHWQKILPELSSSCQRYDIELTFREILSKWDASKAGVQATGLWAEFRDFWTDRFFAGRHMLHDEPYPGAVDFVKRLQREGFEVAYLTGRDRPRTGQGTVDALRHAGFPLGGGAHLFMKPRPEQGDLEFKHRAAAVLRSRFEVTTFLDNEPENLVMAAAEFSQADIVLHHTVMSDRVPAQDFRKLLGERAPLRLISYK